MDFPEINLFRQTILSFHGGGVRGILSASILCELEKKYDILKDITVYAGTSTGAIIAIALSLGVSPKEILDFYNACLPKIFPKTKRIIRKCILFAPFCLYSSQKLRECLINILKDKVDKNPEELTFQDCKKRTIIVSVRLEDYSPVIYDSKYNGDVNLINAVISSCSAPFYFKSYKYNDAEQFTFIDGGLAANSPSLVAANSLIKEGETVFNMMTLGTGLYRYNPSEKKLMPRPMKKGEDAFKCCIESNAEISEMICRNIIPKERYISINPLLNEDIKLDDSSGTTKTKLLQVARTTLEDSDVLQKIKEWTTLISNYRSYAD